MDISAILTYFSLLLALYVFSPNYIKIKLSLSKMIYLLPFLLSLILIYLLSFEIFKNWFIKFFSNHDNKNDFDLFFMILISFHFISFYLLFTTSKLNKFNKWKFLDWITQLINLNKINDLYKIINENINTIFKIYYKWFSFKDKLLNKYKQYYNISIILTDEQKNIIYKIAEWKNITDVEEDEIEEILDKKKSLLKKISSFFKKINLNNFNYLIHDILFNKLNLKYSERPEIENIFNIVIFQLWNSYSLNDIDLGFKIIKNLVKYKNKNHLKNFIDIFILNILKNKDSLLTRQIIDFNTTTEWVKGAYYTFLINNIDIELLWWVIDLAIHDIIFKNQENINLLNQKYIPWNNKYARIDNVNIVNHLWALLDIYRKIDNKNYLDENWYSRIGNFFYYTVKDLVYITDFSKETWNDWYLQDSASMYLVKEIIELLWDLNDLSKCNEMLSFNSILNLILSNSEIPNYYKKSVVEDYYYFVLNWKKELLPEKFEYFKELFTRFPNIKYHFKLDTIDKLKFLYTDDLKVFFEFIK